MARALIESGSLAGERGHYRPAGPGAEIALPTTVLDVLAARIDRLEPLAKRLLQTASVLGRVVPYELLQAVWPPGQDPHDALACLAAAELFYQTRFIPQAEYTFRHALTRQVAYGSLTRARRAALHAEAAEAMERIWSGNLDTVIEALADHWEAGERWDRAAACLLRAAHKAKARHGLDQARQLSERALAAAERASAAIAAGVDALVLLGDLAGLKGDPEEAIPIMPTLSALKPTLRAGRRSPTAGTSRAT